MPIFLKATAGMRSLNISDQVKKIKIIQEILSNSSFKFENKFAEVISGIEESYFGWISINYVKGILQVNDKAKSQVNKTWGSLDMGGSSIEISFVPVTPVAKNAVELDLGHLSYSLFSTVIEGYGQDEALTVLTNNLASKSATTNPCFIKGYTDNTTNLTGSGNFDECEKEVNDLISDVNTQYTTFANPGDMDFVAMNGFAYTANFLGISDTEKASPSDLLNKTKEFCAKTWTKAKEENPTLEDDYLKVYCFTGTFYYHLLVDVFGFSSETKNILFASKIGDITLAWPLGAMAYEAGLLPFN